ncbi:uncharacterized protein LOC106869694 isoform X1 [Octopus bimaculoides]|uniref:Uncharacterized protein n=1 Tax=Octopus bimaculoides TaxID=37653 RepID=A0A0L8HMV3_OCTBM|nr:uncharacterized protein LOC106869694 isoform X1 [Octopus bimaculoides]|eukprot:XP_014771018.1 PREDICTED: uncharacterized protein LOC106869694 isoform X1 [Octopus bimaculoides]
MPMNFASSASKWMKIALASHFFGTLMFLVGFSTYAWLQETLKGNTISVGLWKTRSCDRNGGCITFDSVSSHSQDWFKACQALEILGLIALLLAFIILFLYMFVETCRGRNALLAIMICTFAGVAFIIIGVIIFNTKKGSSLYEIGWSMGLAIAGAVFAFIAGVMVVLGYLGK